jgi:hypothetical protein
MSYVDLRPQSKIGQVRIALMLLLEQHLRDQAIPTSVRFLFYELVARRIVAKTGERPDKIVSRALTWLRLRRLVATRIWYAPVGLIIVSYDQNFVHIDSLSHVIDTHRSPVIDTDRYL